MSYQQHLNADEIVDELKRQLKPRWERGLKPDHIEMSEAYAASARGRAPSSSILRTTRPERSIHLARFSN